MLHRTNWHLEALRAAGSGENQLKGELRDAWDAWHNLPWVDFPSQDDGNYLNPGCSVYTSDILERNLVKLVYLTPDDVNS